MAFRSRVKSPKNGQFSVPGAVTDWQRDTDLWARYSAETDYVPTPMTRSEVAGEIADIYGFDAADVERFLGCQHTVVQID